MRYRCKYAGGWKERILVHKHGQLEFKVEKRVLFFGSESIFFKNDQVFLRIRYHNYIFGERVKVVKDFLDDKMEFDLTGRKVNLIRNGSIYKWKGHHVYKDEEKYAIVNSNWNGLVINFIFRDAAEVQVMYFILTKYIDAVT